MAAIFLEKIMAKMTPYEFMLTGGRESNIRKGKTSKAGARSRRLSTSELLDRARSGKATTYEGYLLSRRRSMGGRGG